MLSHIWNDIKASYQASLEKWLEAKNMPREHRRILFQALKEVNPDLIPKELRVAYPGFYRHLKRLSEMWPVPFYMPQKRTGRWKVNLIDPVENKVVFSADFQYRSEAEDFAEAIRRGDINKVKEWFKKLGVTPPEDIQNLFAFKVKAEEIKRIPFEAGEGIDFSKTVAFLKNIAERASFEDVRSADLWEALADDIDDFLKAMGWSGHLIHRKNIPGFSLKLEEAEKRLRGYLYGYGLSRAKKEAMEEAYGAFYRLGRRRPVPTELVQYMHDYLDYVFGTPEGELSRRVARGLGLWYLGLRLKSIVVNATQNFTSGLAAYIHHRIPAKQLAVGYRKLFDRKALTLADKKALVKLIKSGQLDAKVWQESLNQWRKAGDWLEKTMLPFQLVETYWNRMSHFLGAFDYFHHKMRMPFDKAYQRALNVMLEGPGEAH